MNTNPNAIKTAVLSILVATLFNSGCAQSIPWKAPKMFSLDSTWPFRDKDAPHEGTPVRIVSTWADTVLSQPGQKPQRGFGGRLMFYDKDGKAPILVDGQLVVYAFDEAGRDPTDNKPTRRYVFPADQVPLHMSKSALGASYSFWLPWDDVGGPKTEVSLVCRFEPKAGGVVTGEQTREVLPGPVRTAAVAKNGAKQPPTVPEGVPTRPPQQTLESLQRERNAERNAQLISYEAPVAANQQAQVANGAPQVSTTPEKHMTSTTIALPPSYQLPNAAALNAAAQAANYPQVPVQVPQPFVPNGTPLQMPAGSRTYVAQLPAASTRPIGTTQPYARRSSSAAIIQSAGNDGQRRATDDAGSTISADHAASSNRCRPRRFNQRHRLYHGGQRSKAAADAGRSDGDDRHLPGPRPDGPPIAGAATVISLRTSRMPGSSEMS